MRMSWMWLGALVAACVPSSNEDGPADWAGRPCLDGACPTGYVCVSNVCAFDSSGGGGGRRGDERHSISAGAGGTTLREGDAAGETAGSTWGEASSGDADTEGSGGVNCGPGAFACSQSGPCFPVARACDGEVDCPNGADEGPACPDDGCSATEYACGPSGPCIPREWECDHQRDCDSGRDEGPQCDDGDDGSVFLSEPDISTDHIACDVWAQDCEPTWPGGQEQKCHPYVADGGAGWNGLICDPIVDAPAGPGELCAISPDFDVSRQLDNCDGRSFCFNTNEDGIGVCTRFCQGSAAEPICPAGLSCSMTNSGVLNLCLPSCDPIAQDCGPGMGCYGLDDVFVCVSDVSGEEGGAFRDDCANVVNACEAGYACVDGGLSGCGWAYCCTPYCTADDDCGMAPGLSCVRLFAEGDAPPGMDDVGLCTY